MDRTAVLVEALAVNDAGRARSLVAQLPGDHAGRERLLAALARAAVHSPLAVEIFVETIDRSGLPRAAASKFLVTEDAVEDVAQEVLIAVATAVGRFDGRSRVSTWVHAIARHRAIDYLRRARATTPLADDEVGEVQRISSLIASRAAVDQLLARLPDDYRHAVALRDVQQLPYDEVAGRLGCSLSTARTRVARGRALAARMIAAETDR